MDRLRRVKPDGDTEFDIIHLTSERSKLRQARFKDLIPLFELPLLGCPFVGM
jgi:hypothetical protein